MEPSAPLGAPETLCICLMLPSSWELTKVQLIALQPACRDALCTDPVQQHAQILHAQLLRAQSCMHTSCVHRSDTQRCRMQSSCAQRHCVHGSRGYNPASTGSVCMAPAPRCCVHRPVCTNPARASPACTGAACMGAACTGSTCTDPACTNPTFGDVLCRDPACTHPARTAPACKKSSRHTLWKQAALAGKSSAPTCSSTSNLPPSATLQVLLVLTATSVPLG